MFHIVAAAPDNDPADDLTEGRQHTMYALTLHEFGHTLGLGHGGSDAVNCKPNYPSNMNYAYDLSFNVDGFGQSLSDNQLQYSTGQLNFLDETLVSESQAFSSNIFQMSFIRYYGHGFSPGYRTFVNPVDPTRTDVDWDRSGGFTAGPEDISQVPIEDLILRDPAAGQQCGIAGPDDEPTTLYDNDDSLTIAEGLDTRRTVNKSAEEDFYECLMDDPEEGEAQAATALGPMEMRFAPALLEAAARLGVSAEDDVGALSDLEGEAAVISAASLLIDTKRFLSGPASHHLAHLLDARAPIENEGELGRLLEARLLQHFGKRLRVQFVDCERTIEALAARSELLRQRASEDSFDFQQRATASAPFDSERWIAAHDILRLCR